MEKKNKDMKHYISMLGALLLLLTTTSCRQDSDSLYNYAIDDPVIFSDAKKSFEKQFEIFWHGMDQNYCLFSYERNFGLDWDAIYDEYLPQFQALDKQETVTDDELRLLIANLTSGIHDGHFDTTFLNYMTGNYITVTPSDIANTSRPDYSTAYSFTPDLTYYAPSSLGGNGEFKTWNTGSSLAVTFFNDLRDNPSKGVTWVSAQVKALTVKSRTSSLTDHEVFLLDAYKDLLNRLIQMYKAGYITPAFLKNYNDIVSSFALLKVPGLEPYDEALQNNGMQTYTGVTQDNIAYLYMSNFNLSPCLSENIRTQFFPNLSESGVALLKPVENVWKQWFQSVQDLLKSGQLKGVILDLRSNPGGLFYDFQYVLGSLLPSGDHQIGYAYYKRGMGRYDYSTTMPEHASAYPEAHEAITTQPLVILTNSSSVSMSEITTLSAKELLHACQIGTRTWGALCPLSDNNYYSIDFSGHVGVQGKTPVHCTIAQQVFTDLEGHIYDGVGLQPDIELAFDDNLYKTQKRDNQFERALDFIRNNK